ncbi:T-complex protein 11-like protein 1 [Halyomorpha halys]|uniref:T-complex protein 11-like protein 1 n=1 Tax=Halyomorpha halys TaxID=286706 RepID=UPI0006D50832|nr:T-complex protein 11-like protein 1 [Halyomorpha halys]XP_014280131.1 T-complex protein 11-like protein 1 [Halyomorpha halys]
MEGSNSNEGKPNLQNSLDQQSDVPIVSEEEMEKYALLQKLNLAHEIGLDQSFTLKKEEPPDNSLEKVVTEAVHSAFWDLFKQRISEDPPNLSMALSLLNEIKEGLYDIMMPHQTKLKSEVDEILDLDLLKQQALHGALDVMYFAQYILSVMKRLCAPIRDEKIEELSKETELVALFRGILETLKLMKLDMVNFTLFSIRPELVSNHMEYERQKFTDYIKLSGDNLPVTEAWLKKHIKPSVNIKDVLYNAFLDLLTWDSNHPYPETLILDEKRLLKLKEEYYLMVMTATIVLLSFNSIPPQIQSDISLKEDLKQHIGLLLEGVKSDQQLSQGIQNVIEQIKKDINDKLSSRDMNNLNDEQVTSLSQQIQQVTDLQNRVRGLVNLRVLDFLKLTLMHPGGKTNFPPALVLFKKELESLSNSFMNIVLYNINICFEHYKKIFTKNEASSSSVSNS